MSRLVVSEIFGPTLQGEGPSSGKRAMFLRLSGCNLSCEWCDTPYTWDWSRFNPRAEAVKMETDNVYRRLMTHWTPLVVITGGEPLLQVAALHELIPKLWRRGIDVEIETNGTRTRPKFDADVRFNVSPKLSSAGPHMSERERIHPIILSDYIGKDCIWKFVLSTLTDIGEVTALVTKFGMLPERVWLMPEASTVEELNDGRLEIVARQALERGYNVSDRLHLRLWGGKRGH